jgi:hypothetical protein
VALKCGNTGIVGYRNGAVLENRGLNRLGFVIGTVHIVHSVQCIMFVAENSVC